MSTRTRTDDRASATESKFYLPAVASAPSDPGRFERLRAALFDHAVESPE